MLHDNTCPNGITCEPLSEFCCLRSVELVLTIGKHFILEPLLQSWQNANNQRFLVFKLFVTIVLPDGVFLIKTFVNQYNI